MTAGRCGIDQWDYSQTVTNGTAGERARLNSEITQHQEGGSMLQDNSNSWKATGTIPAASGAYSSTGNSSSNSNSRSSATSFGHLRIPGLTD